MVSRRRLRSESWAPSVKLHEERYCRHCRWSMNMNDHTSPRYRTFDHIVPKNRRKKVPEGLRNQGWPSCRECNGLRARLNHCPAVTRLVMVETQRRWGAIRPIDLAREWGILDTHHYNPK